MNLLAIALHEIALLDHHLDGRLRSLLYEVARARLEPAIEVAREMGDGRSRWFLIVRGHDVHGRPQREDRLEVQLGPRFPDVVVVVARMHLRSYVREVRDELAAMCNDDFGPDEEAVYAAWRSMPPHGQPS